MTCARCGAGVGNGGVDTCTILSGIDPATPGTVRTLRFCLDRTEDGQPVQGCTTVLLAYLEETKSHG